MKKQVIGPFVCDRCGMNPREQLTHRLGHWKGLCFPGRCAVKGLVWVVRDHSEEMDERTRAAVLQAVALEGHVETRECNPQAAEEACKCP